MTSSQEQVPDTFSKTLTNFGIDVRGKHVLEVGSGGGEQAVWLAGLGAKKVDALDPIYKDDIGDERKSRFKDFSADVLQRVNFVPSTIENYIARGGGAILSCLPSKPFQEIGKVLQAP